MSHRLETRGLQVQVGGLDLCRDLDLRIEAGQCWAVLGRNGVGKTTLLHHLGGLQPVPRGRVWVDGEDLAGLTPRRRARRVAILLQHSDAGFGASVQETVLTGRHPHLAALAWEGAADLALAEHWIAATGLTALARRPLDRLSGGELRRVEIARLLTQDCPLMLLDEPLNHLDLAHQATILQLLVSRCVDHGYAALMVLHDLNVAWQACDHWLLLDGAGGWRAGPREQVGDAGLLSAAFGHPVQRLEVAGQVLFHAPLAGPPPVTI